MPSSTKKSADDIGKILILLRKKFKNVEAYRYNSASIRVRIVDSTFSGKPYSEREEKVWPMLLKLPDDIRADITLLLLLSPEETATSMMNVEFEHPSPSAL